MLCCGKFTFHKFDEQSVVIHTVKSFGKIKCTHIDRRAIVYITVNNVSNTVDNVSATQGLYKSKLIVRCNEKHRESIQYSHFKYSHFTFLM